MVARQPTAEELNDIKQNMIHWPTESQKFIDILFAIRAGDIPGFSIVNKFGSGEVGTSITPVSSSLTYPTPTAAVALELLSDDVNDNVTGTGAREIVIQGLDLNWEECTCVVTTNGTTPVAVPQDLTRIYRAYVSKSGSYATQTVGSHQGVITVREVATPANVWMEILNAPFPNGQTEIGVFTVPKGKTAYMISKNMFTDTSKTADLYFFQRAAADVITAPYSAMRLVEREVGVKGGYSLQFKSAKGPFVGPCDIGFMGNVSVGTAIISVEFELILVEDGA